MKINNNTFYYTKKHTNKENKLSKNISFKGFSSDYIKCLSQKPAFKSFFNVQKFASLFASFGYNFKNSDLISDSLFGLIPKLNDTLCNEYDDKDAKENLNYNAAIMVPIVKELNNLTKDDETKSKIKSFIQNILDSLQSNTLFSNITRWVISKLFNPNIQRAIINFSIVELYGSFVIGYLEYRKYNKEAQDNQNSKDK